MNVEYEHLIKASKWGHLQCRLCKGSHSWPQEQQKQVQKAKTQSAEAGGSQDDLDPAQPTSPSFHEILLLRFFFLNIRRFLSPLPPYEFLQ